MYRILIADDEPLEREGMELIIKTMVSRQVEIIHAKNGREAIQQAIIHKPHIVLMDIRMPGIDGIQALKEIKAEHPSIKMVLVTAYEYFEYAREAIQIGVKDYLVKPTKRKEIVALLEKLFVEIEKELALKEVSEKNFKRLSTFTDLAKTELALRLMSEQITEESIQSLAELVQFNIGQSCGLVVAFPNLTVTSRLIESTINEWVKTYINQYTTITFNFIRSTVLNEHMAIFLSYEGDYPSSTIFNAINQIARHIVTQCATSLSLDAYIGIGSLKHDIAGIKRSYFEAIFASTNVNQDEPICLFEEMKQLLTQPLLVGNGNQAVYVQKAIEKIKQEREHETFTMIDRVTDYIAKNYNRELSLEEAAEYVHLNPYYFSKVFKQQTGETFIDYLTQVRISHAKRWMEQKDLSLKEICYLVGYNDPNYLSRVFKKVVGQTPSEYRQSLS